MARYNEILTGRFSRALQKLASMKGDAPSPQLAAEIQPGFTLPLGVEFRYLEQWNRFANAAAVVEVGGVSPTSYLVRNPVTSNVIAVMERIHFSSSAVNDAVAVALGPVIGDLPTAQTPQRLDSRITSLKSSTIVSSSTAFAGSPPQSIDRYTLPTAGLNAEQIFDENQEIPLLPGDGLQFTPAIVVAGTTLNIQVIWRERQLEESERF